jgi:IclR family acetate operon transcriptional repressor
MVLISAPRFRVDKDQLEVLVSACVLAAKDITRRLGGRPPVDAGLPQGADSTAG